jgi:membrane-bound metal-dependent hydrolase YbcI (DUF457 family)
VISLKKSGFVKSLFFYAAYYLALGYLPATTQATKIFRSFRSVFALVTLGYILHILPDNFTFQPVPR